MKKSIAGLVAIIFLGSLSGFATAADSIDSIDALRKAVLAVSTASAELTLNKSESVGLSPKKFAETAWFKKRMNRLGTAPAILRSLNAQGIDLEFVVERGDYSEDLKRNLVIDLDRNRSGVDLILRLAKKGVLYEFFENTRFNHIDINKNKNRLILGKFFGTLDNRGFQHSEFSQREFMAWVSNGPHIAMIWNIGSTEHLKKFWALTSQYGHISNSVAARFYNQNGWSYFHADNEEQTRILPAQIKTILGYFENPPRVGPPAIWTCGEILVP